MKKFLVFICFVLVFSSKAIGKETTYSKELFEKAISDGKVVVVSSWIKYCSSCAGQMKVLKKAKKDFDNMEYFAFDVTNKEIAKFFNVQYQTTLLIFKIIAGKNVAIKKDKNNKDWAIKGENKSLDKNTPTNKLLEKSGNGNIKNPATRPIIIET